MNFIQFMRTPSSLDDPEMVPVDIVAESGPPTPPAGATEPEHAAAAAKLKPIIVGAVMIDDPTSAAAVAAAAASPPSLVDADTVEEGEGPCLRAWAVESPTGSNDVDESAKFSDGDSETGLVSAAAAAAAVAADASTAVLPPAAPPTNVIGVDISAAAAAAAAAAVSGAVDHDLSSFGDYMVGEDADGNCDMECAAASPAAAAAAADIHDDTDVPRAEASPSWDSSTTEGEEDSDGNVMRARRSISNLETARRMGAGLDSEITSDDTDSGSDDLEEDADVVRPRALSLDGWFTCGLEKGRPLKCYDTHDHAGRLRDIVKLVRYFVVFPKFLFFLLNGYMAVFMFHVLLRVFGVGRVASWWCLLCGTWVVSGFTRRCQDDAFADMDAMVVCWHFECLLDIRTLKRANAPAFLCLLPVHAADYQCPPLTLP